MARNPVAFAVLEAKCSRSSCAEWTDRPRTRLLFWYDHKGRAHLPYLSIIPYPLGCICCCCCCSAPPLQRVQDNGEIRLVSLRVLASRHALALCGNRAFMREGCMLQPPMHINRDPLLHLASSMEKPPSCSVHSRIFLFIHHTFSIQKKNWSVCVGFAILGMAYSVCKNTSTAFWNCSKLRSARPHCTVTQYCTDT